MSINALRTRLTENVAESRPGMNLGIAAADHFAVNPNTGNQTVASLTAAATFLPIWKFYRAVSLPESFLITRIKSISNEF
jgi:hypothetical protein